MTIAPLSKLVNGKSRVEEKQERKTRDYYDWRACCALVDARDEGQCRVCGKRANPFAMALLDRLHRHHIVYVSAGGVDQPWNILSVCASCHGEIHVLGTLCVEGDADLRDLIGRLCGVQVSRLRGELWEVEAMV